MVRALSVLQVACIDQRDPAADLAKLPLAIACCERLVTFVADGYATRGWCRIEQLLARRFSFADHQNVIDQHYVNRCVTPPTPPPLHPRPLHI